MNWWERRLILVALMALAVVPLLWPTIPPLMDLPGHMGRYRVELDGVGSPLRQFYAFRWMLIGNLGVDVLIVPVAALFGLELGVKLIVMAIVAMTCAGMLLIAREVHGRVPPTALFALPLAYSYPFQFGFVNFSLAVAFAMLAFALWLHLTRYRRYRTRAVVFLIISPLIWITHIYGLGVLGILTFMAELNRVRSDGNSWRVSLLRSVGSCLVLAPPMLVAPFFHDVSGNAGSSDWFNWSNKIDYIGSILQDRWYAFDIGSVAILIGLVGYAAVTPRLAFSRSLMSGVAALCVIYLMLPTMVLDSVYADMRLAPTILMLAILAIGPSPAARPRFLNGLAVAGLLVFGIRIAATTVSYVALSARYDRALAALDHLPAGARMLTLTDRSWANRLEHLAGMAIVRRRAFSNDQWNSPGMNLMSVVKDDAGGFGSDPSQRVTANDAPADGTLVHINKALADFPRDGFDYLWLIAPPDYDRRLTRRMTAVWRDGDDVLFRIDRR